jgi:hypothetical protein
MTATCHDILCTVARRLAFMEPLRERPVPDASASEVVVAVDFDGRRSGAIHVIYGHGLPRELAINMLPPQAEEEWTAHEAALEAANVIAGNLLPALDPEGRELRLSVPRLAARPVPPWRETACIELTEGLLSVIVTDAAPSQKSRV